MDGLHRHRPMHGILFAEDLDDPAPPAVAIAHEAPPPEPVFTQDDLDAARREGHEAGWAAATEAARASEADRVAAALEAIASAMRTAQETATAFADTLAMTMARDLFNTVRTILPRLCDRHGEADVVHLARRILPTMTYEPAIRVRVHPDLATAIEAEIAALDPEIIPRVTLIPTPQMRRGDLRVIWKDAQFVRDTRAICEEIETALAPLTLWEPPPACTDDAPTTAGEPSDV
jgi:flagellar assembly protein FliH